MYNPRVDLRGAIYLAYNGGQHCFVFLFCVFRYKLVYGKV